MPVILRTLVTSQRRCRVQVCTHALVIREICGGLEIIYIINELI